MIRKERQEKRKRKGRIAALAAAMLVTALTAQTSVAATTPLSDIWGELKDGCSITVMSPDKSEDGVFDALLAGKENVQLDFYKIAAADLAEGGDAYEFAWDPAYSDQQTAWETLVDAKLAEDAADPKITAADIDELTQGLADVVLKTVPEYGSGEEAATGGIVPNLSKKLDEKVPVSAGMYLLIAHGDIADYKMTKDAISTVAPIGTKLYQFAPMLVSVPQRGQLDKDIQAIGEGMIAGNEEWTYPLYFSRSSDEGEWNGDMKIKAKVAEADMGEFGRLRIQKVLPVNETMSNRLDTATFVFRIEATLNGNPVYSDAETIEFDGTTLDGPIEIADKLPVGAEVTVTEIYAGGDYGMSTASAALADGSAVEYTSVSDGVTVKILPYDENTKKDIITVTFTNTYSDTWKGGGSVENKFEANGDNWAVKPVYNDAKAVTAE